MQEGTWEARVVIWFIVTTSMTRIGEIKDGLCNESLLDLMLVYPHKIFCPDLFMLITEITLKDK